MVHQELQAILVLGVIEESHSGCRSSIVLVPKPNDLTQFCIDSQKVNTLSKFDTYPMNWVDETLGTAEYISNPGPEKRVLADHTGRGITKKDNLSYPSRDPFGLYQFVTVLFGLRGPTAPFSS